MAQVLVSFEAWKAGAVAPAKFEVPVRVFDVRESPQLLATWKADASVWQVAWAPDGKTLASLVNSNGEVTLWDVATQQPRATLKSELGQAYSMAFSPAGKILAVAHYKRDPKLGIRGGIALWDISSNQRVALLKHAHEAGVSSLAVAPDGKMLAALENWRPDPKGPFKSRTVLWDLPAGKIRTSFNDEEAARLAFSPDGQVLARSVYTIKDRKIDGVEIRRFAPGTGKHLPPLLNTANKNPINVIAFSPDGRTAVGADYAGGVLLWDIRKAAVRQAVKLGEQEGVTDFAFAPDGRLLAGALAARGRDPQPGVIVLLDPATGKERGRLTGHRSGVTSVAFSPDGRQLASASADQTIRLWDVAGLTTARD